MKNVYEAVRNFYTDKSNNNQVLKKDWVEGYMRQKAWQGASDGDLQNDWRYIEAFARYLQSDEGELLGFLEEMPAQEYGMAIQWMSINTGFNINLKNVRKFFKALQGFFAYLTEKKIIVDHDELSVAAKEIAGGKKVLLFPPTLMNADIFDGDSGSMQADYERFMALGKTVEQLMNKLGSYFQQKKFADDFQRALFLYNGPVNPLPEDGQDEFWLGFWDYFLFDYHLLKTDTKPLEHFYVFQNKTISEDEQHMLLEFISAKFCLFYIDKVVNKDLVECVNLLTDERFKLPHPHFSHKLFKNNLFYGHVFYRDNLMINCVTGVEISTRLRQRIKEEIIRQKILFNVQEPDADWDAMLERHAASIRHTIDLLSTVAKVNVTPLVQINRSYPLTESLLVERGEKEALDIAFEKMASYSFSLHDMQLAAKMWVDFVQIYSPRIRKPQAWAGALIFSFSRINDFNIIPVGKIAKDLGISNGTIYTNELKIFSALELQRFDPRYVNEEGFMLSLF